MDKNTLRRAVNVVATLAAIGINGLANALPINGQNTGEISDRFVVYFVPAGYVFAIWGVIYLGLIASAVFQALPGQRSNQRLNRLGYWYALGCAANAVWILLWHYELFPFTLVAMGTLLLSLIVCYLRLGIGRLQVSPGERWAVHVPISIYLGWITVATVANVTAVLDYWKWSGWGISPVAWAVIMLAVGAAIAVAMDLSRGDIAYTAVIVWAFAGIAVKHAGTPPVAWTAWTLIIIVIVPLLAAVPRVRSRRRVAG